MRRVLLASAMAVTSIFVLTGCVTGSAATVTAIGSTHEGALPAAVTAQLTRTLNADLKLAGGGSGAIAGVWAPWSGSWREASGTSSSVKGASRMSVDSSFRIGSLTKPLTCTVLLRLVAAKKVRLDDTVSTYLPRMVGIDGLTLGELCRNTSGLADYWGTLTPQIVTNPGRDWDSIELIDTALGQPHAGTPGQRFAYSNAGFVLLGLTLQLATGMSWQQLYQRYVIDPLGISGSTSYPSADAVPRSSFTAYAADRDVVTGALDCSRQADVTLLSPTATQQAGGVVSDLDDTASLAHAVAAGALLPKSLATVQRTTGAMSRAMPSWAGYGLGVEKMGPLIGHASAAFGTSTAAYSDPASGLTVVVMFNTSNQGANFARLVALQLASIASKAAPDAGKKAPAIGLPWSTGQLASALPHVGDCPSSTSPIADAAVRAIAAIGPQY